MPASLSQILTNAAAANGIPPALLLAQAQQESGMNPSIVNSRTGAAGLLQLEPGTASGLGVTNLLDPTQNANGGAAYLQQLYQRFGDWSTALAAYDWGPTNVANAQAKYGAGWLSYAPSETQNYVTSILAAAPAATSSTADVIDLPTDALDTTDAGAVPFPAAGPGSPSVGAVLALTGLGVGVYLLVSDLADW